MLSRNQHVNDRVPIQEALERLSRAGRASIGDDPAWSAILEKETLLSGI